MQRLVYGSQHALVQMDIPFDADSPHVKQSFGYFTGSASSLRRLDDKVLKRGNCAPVSGLIELTHQHTGFFASNQRIRVTYPTVNYQRQPAAEVLGILGRR